jgi:ribonuclease P protein component
MLKKQNRLQTNYEFGRVRRFGGKYRCELFDLYYLKQFSKAQTNPINAPNSTNSANPANSSSSRFGIVISNKFSKSAVVRNRVKRVFREVLRLNLDKIGGGFWIVFYPRLLSINKGYEEINAEFNKVLPKLPFAR